MWLYFFVIYLCCIWTFSSSRKHLLIGLLRTGGMTADRGKAKYVYRAVAIFANLKRRNLKMLTNAGRIHSVRMDNKTFERVEEFKYLGTNLTNQNSIPEEIKSRLRSGNACYHSVQNLLPSRLLSKNFKIKIYITIILPVVLYGCETWSMTLREERKLRVFENTVLRIFGPMRDEVTEEWRRLLNEELNDLYSSPNREEWDGLGMWRVWVRRKGCIGSCWGNRREGDLGDACECGNEPSGSVKCGEFY